jgi:hypothetical protein
MTKELKDNILKIIRPLADLKAEAELREEEFEKVGLPAEYDPKTGEGGYVSSAQWEYDRAKWKYKTNLRFIFQEAVKALFRMTYGLESVGWYQHSSHYDDSCYFDCTFSRFGRAVNPAAGFTGYRTSCRGTKEQRETVDWFFEQFREEDFLLLFGDHVLVTVTPEGATIKPYDDGESLQYAQ